MTELFDRLHDDDDDDPQEVRIDSGDGLPPEQVCSFRDGIEPDGDPCPHEATQIRTMNDVPFPACRFHENAGGFLNPEGRRLLVAGLVAQENARALIRQTLDGDGQPITFPRFCSGCGARLFTGNTSGLCSTCATTEAIDALNGGADGPIDVELSADELRREHTGVDYAIPCSCETRAGIVQERDPLCRVHGLEDVLSGAYDASPNVRRAVDREIAEGLR